MRQLRKSLSTQAPVRSRPRSHVRVRLAALLGPPLIALSCYGFWQMSRLPIQESPPTLEKLIEIMTMTSVPVVIFVYLAIAAGQRFEYLRLSGSYQARIDLLQKRLHEQEDLLHAITDQDPDAIAIFDQDNRFWFLNPAAASEWRVDSKQAIGSTPSRVLSADQGHKLETQLAQVREKGKELRTLEQRPGRDGNALRFMQTSMAAARPFAGFDGGVLMRSEDVTALMVEREKRESMLQQLINTMVAVVDRRDPYASGHSGRVGQLSRAIAEEMLLPEVEIESAEIAGSLMNFGKVLVSRSILTKASALTPEELQRVRDSIMVSADILSIINFAGPVVPTLRQVLERYDGSGAPLGLKGAAILPTASIVMVANAFVALASPRAHRPSLSNDDAVAVLQRDSGRAYDPRIVLALANCVKNPKRTF